ncbi:MAG: type II toxin-antitoxin system HicA family toxin [Waterburya sp.]
MSKIAKLIKYLLSRPPEVRFEEISYVLRTFDYQEVRVKGSHHVFENDQGDVIVPKRVARKLKELI